LGVHTAISLVATAIFSAYRTLSDPCEPSNSSLSGIPPHLLNEINVPQIQGQKASLRNLLVCKNVHTYNSYLEHLLQNIHEAFVLYPL
jgi:hypothetical protein